MENSESMEAKQNFDVEVVYGLVNKQSLLRINVKEGCTALEAVQLSNIQGEFPEIDMDNLKLGIFSKACTADQILKSGDRVEIYRPLLADPKEIRKRRAAEMAAKKQLESEGKPAKRKRGKNKNAAD